MIRPEPADSGRAPAARAWILFLSAVLGVALVGYVIGLRQRAVPGGGFPDTESELPRSGVAPTTSYQELQRRDLGPNANFRSNLAALSPRPAEAPRVAPDRPITAADKRAALADRSILRAYNGAPPTIPHAVTPRSSKTCLVCHEEGLEVGDRVARPMPHAELTQCLQCHVAANPDLGEPELSEGNEFTGIAAPFAGARAWEGAPPVIPHTTRMRDDCLACHGSLGRFGLRTTHPERRSCLQCHAPSAEHDRLPLGKPGVMISDRRP